MPPSTAFDRHLETLPEDRRQEAREWAMQNDEVFKAKIGMGVGDLRETLQRIEKKMATPGWRAQALVFSGAAATTLGLVKGAEALGLVAKLWQVLLSP